MNRTKRDPNAIYDRHGNRIRIWVGNDEEEKEIDRKMWNTLLKKGFGSLKKHIIYFLIRYPKILITLFSNEIRKEKIRKLIIKEMMKMKQEPKYIRLEYKKTSLKLSFFSSIPMIKEVIIDDQYNANFKNLKNKIIIDAGANVGLFSFFALMLGAKKAYAFEPVKETYNVLKNDIKINKLENKLIAINKALGDKNETKTISFTNAGDVEASLKEERKKGKLEESILIIKLDDFVKENKLKRVDFIKMDVEGYEENVLLGAKETIKKWKPILSFSAYHLPTDKERLPKVVLSIRPDYRIKLNKYADENFYCE